MMFRKLLSTIELYKNAFLIAHETLQVCHNKRSWIFAITQLDCGSHIARCIDPRTGELGKVTEWNAGEWLEHGGFSYIVTYKTLTKPVPSICMEYLKKIQRKRKTTLKKFQRKT